MKENLILVIYVGVAGVREEDIQTITHKIAKKIIPVTFQGEIIVIPIQSPNSRIECINPKYITNEELVNEHTELMKKLQEELQHQADSLKNSGNNE